MMIRVGTGNLNYITRQLYNYTQYRHTRHATIQVRQHGYEEKN